MNKYVMELNTKLLSSEFNPMHYTSPKKKLLQEKLQKKKKKVGPNEHYMDQVLTNHFSPRLKKDICCLSGAPADKNTSQIPTKY